MNFKKGFFHLSLLFVFTLLVSACSGIIQGGQDVLRILNWEDYIYLQDKPSGYEAKDFIKQFEDHIYESEGKKVSVIYDTFDTNETMLNSLQTGKSVYDLVCPSDYMIQKMIVNDMLEPLDPLASHMPNYLQYVSPYLKEVFENIEATNKVTNTTHKVSEYAVGYMWGTLGLLYNPSFKTFVNHEITEEEVHQDLKDWNSLWHKKYKNTISLKDSMRDTYSVGVMRLFDQEIKNLQATYLDETLATYDQVTYNELLTQIFNRSDLETVNKVKDELMVLKENIYGFETDSGKQDIVTGKIGINLAWSGDAVYAMDQADEEIDTALYYVIPETGGNVWFDGWVMPKSDSLNKDLAQKFMDFVSRPINAAQNMDYIGYSSFIGGEEINDLIHTWYDVREEDWQEPLVDPENYVAYDLTYFFGDTVTSETIIYINEEDVNRQLSAQYPEGSKISRLAIMNDFGDNNAHILKMWEEFKASSLPTWAIILIVIAIITLLGFGSFFIYQKKATQKKRSARRKTTKA